MPSRSQASFRRGPNGSDPDDLPKASFALLPAASIPSTSCPPRRALRYPTTTSHLSGASPVALFICLAFRLSPLSACLAFHLSAICVRPSVFGLAFKQRSAPISQTPPGRSQGLKITAPRTKAGRWVTGCHPEGIKALAFRIVRSRLGGNALLAGHGIHRPWSGPEKG